MLDHETSRGSHWPARLGMPAWCAHGIGLAAILAWTAWMAWLVMLFEAPGDASCCRSALMLVEGRSSVDTGKRYIEAFHASPR